MKDMTEGSVTRHLLEMSAFIAVSMLMQTLYLLADLYWVGSLGKEAIAAVGLAVLLWKRRRVADLVHTLRWRRFPGQSWQQRAARTAKLLEKRATLAGTPRPTAQTLTAWANGLSPDPALAAMARLAEWAAYAPGLPPPVPENSTLQSPGIRPFTKA